MAGPIYKFYRARWSEAYYQLNAAEREALMAKAQAMLGEFGIKQIVSCDSRAYGEEWMIFGVEEYPDMEAIEKLTAAQYAMDWFRYVHSETMLGKAWE